MYGIMIVWTHLLCLDGPEEIHTGPDILEKKKDTLCSSGLFIRMFPKNYQQILRRSTSFFSLSFVTTEQ
jgi:hypothetical protein